MVERGLKVAHPKNYRWVMAYAPLVSLQLNPAKMQLISGFVDTYLRLNPLEETAFQSELGKMKLEEQEQIM